MHAHAQMPPKSLDNGTIGCQDNKAGTTDRALPSAGSAPLSLQAATPKGSVTGVAVTVKEEESLPLPPGVAGVAPAVKEEESLPLPLAPGGAAAPPPPFLPIDEEKFGRSLTWGAPFGRSSCRGIEFSCFGTAMPQATNGFGIMIDGKGGASVTVILAGRPGGTEGEGRRVDGFSTDAFAVYLQGNAHVKEIRYTAYAHDSKAPSSSNEQKSEWCYEVVLNSKASLFITNKNMTPQCWKYMDEALATQRKKPEQFDF
jgi:hypothetical protein